MVSAQLKPLGHCSSTTALDRRCRKHLCLIVHYQRTCLVVESLHENKKKQLHNKHSKRDLQWVHGPMNVVPNRGNSKKLKVRGRSHLLAQGLRLNLFM